MLLLLSHRSLQVKFLSASGTNRQNMAFSEEMLSAGSAFLGEPVPK